jgi:hypothetical protein
MKKLKTTFLINLNELEDLDDIKDDKEDDNEDNSYFINHLELKGFDFRIMDIEVGVFNLFKAQKDLIKFN